MFSKYFRSQPALKNKPVSVLLGGLVLLSMWSTQIAALFCPHLRGSSDCCLTSSSNHHSHDSISGMHMIHDEMAGMDHMSMPGRNMSDMEASDVSGFELNEVNVVNMPIPSKPSADVNNQAITEPAGTCSHCMMHSQARTVAVLGSVVQSNISHEFIAAERSSEYIALSASNFRFFDLRDHSPPGSSSPRYVLINIFRI